MIGISTAIYSAIFGLLASLFAIMAIAAHEKSRPSATARRSLMTVITGTIAPSPVTAGIVVIGVILSGIYVDQRLKERAESDNPHNFTPSH